MKKLMGLLIIGGLIIAGCSKTETPTEPESTQPRVAFYTGPEAAAHGFVTVSPEVGAKLMNVYYNRYRDEVEAAKVLRKEFDFSFNCNDLFNLLRRLGVSNIPDAVYDLKCKGNIHGKRKDGGGLLDWHIFITLVAGYGIGWQGRVGGAGYLNLAATPLEDMDTIKLGLYTQVQYNTIWEDTFSIVVENNSRFGLSAGGMLVMDFEPQVYTVDINGADEYWLDNKKIYSFDPNLSLTIHQIGGK